MKYKMGIMQWIKDVLDRKRIKKIELPKNNSEDDNLKTRLHYDANNSIEELNLTREQKRIEQIKLIEELVLYKSRELKKEDICKKIEEKYRENVLEDVDMQSLIVLQVATRTEEMYGDCNIRDFIEDDKNNIVELVNELIEKANEEAKIYSEIEVSKLITVSKDSINEIIKKIEEKKNSEKEHE